MSDTASETTTVLTITPLAAEKVLGVMAEQPLGDGEHHLRIFVQGGGCSGPSIGLAFDEARDDDARFDTAGVNVVVDPVSLPYVQGATIDFVETAEVTGFKVTVPEPVGGCSSSGCSTSDCESAGPAAPSGGGCGSGGCS